MSSVPARVGRSAAIFGAIQAVPFALAAGFLIYVLTVLPPTVTFDEHPIALSIWILACAWILILGPLVSVIMGFVALARPVSREKAAR